MMACLSLRPTFEILEPENTAVTNILQFEIDPEPYSIGLKKRRRKLRQTTDLAKFLIFFKLPKELFTKIFEEFLPPHKIPLLMFSFKATFEPMKEHDLFQLYLARSLCVRGLRNIQYRSDLLKMPNLDYSKLEFSFIEVNIEPFDMLCKVEIEDFYDDEDVDRDLKQRLFANRIFKSDDLIPEDIMFAWYGELPSNKISYSGCSRFVRGAFYAI